MIEHILWIFDVGETFSLSQNGVPLPLRIFIAVTCDVGMETGMEQVLLCDGFTASCGRVELNCCRSAASVSVSDSRIIISKYAS